MRPVPAGLAAFLLTGVLLPLGLGSLAPGWSRPVPAPALAPVPLGAESVVRGAVTRRDLSVVRDGRVLAGHLVSPVAGGELAVVLVAGAGPSTRDDMLAEAEALAARGLPAVSYDKTRTGYSWRHRDFAALAADLAAVVAASREVTGVARVGVLGFSEGSWVAARLAAEPGTVDFLVLASAPIVAPLEQSAWILDRRLGRAPDPVRRTAAGLLVAGRGVLTYLDEDPCSRLAAATVPILGIWGADDDTVPVRTAATRLMGAARPPVTVLVLPGADHRLDARSGWPDHVAAWLAAPEPTADTVRGVEPATTSGVPGLPRAVWFTSPLVQLAGATLAAGVTAALLRRRPPTKESSR